MNELKYREGEDILDVQRWVQLGCTSWFCNTGSEYILDVQRWVQPGCASWFCNTGSARTSSDPGATNPPPPPLPVTVCHEALILHLTPAGQNLMAHF